jgi:ABC-type Mn2+/Zn2+ transport system ATPase subunit
MTTHDYPTTADINDTIAVLKQEYKANGEWQTYTSDEK